MNELNGKVMENLVKKEIMNYELEKTKIMDYIETELYFCCYHKDYILHTYINTNQLYKSTNTITPNYHLSYINFQPPLNLNNSNTKT